MAHFYGSMQGSRGEATRCGTKGSGIRAHVRGWDFGCEVLVTDENGTDTVEIWLTPGSNGAAASRLVGRFTRDELNTLNRAKGSQDVQPLVGALASLKESIRNA